MSGGVDASIVPFWMSVPYSPIDAEKYGSYVGYMGSGVPTLPDGVWSNP
ncbi:hypothetical protein [Microbacterium lacticum]